MTPSNQSFYNNEVIKELIMLSSCSRFWFGVVHTADTLYEPESWGEDDLSIIYPIPG